ncbi:hypothetical protein FB45DRAFT_1079303 [Roridomyces roridus]|uniref:Uncharacterized protein n=1 Tax=Roridomyces roridus TaxID=1738132 RepID=A0AAD7BRR8_9AGAR|nr:hypothetical protein FB45DRAFT_1079303 [Roridomyces roridus]
MPYLEHLQIEDNGGEAPTPIDLPSQIGTQFSFLDSKRDPEIFLDVTRLLPSLTHLYIQVQNDVYTLNSGITLKFLTHLHLDFEDGETSGLSSPLTSFDTPCLMHFNITNAHGYQIAMLFNSTQHQRSAGLTFPALTSLAFDYLLFPALSSLALIYECFTVNILSDLLGPDSAPWPSLRTIIVQPQEKHTEKVYTALQDIVRWKRSRQETLPTFRPSASLFEREFWQEHAVLVELLGADEIEASGSASALWAYDG